MSDFDDIMASAEQAVKAGKYSLAQEELKEAVDLCGSGSIKNRLKALMRLAQVNEITGEWVDALMYLDNIIQTATSSKYSVIKEEALVVSGNILSKKGKWRLAKKRFEQVIEDDGRKGSQAKALIGLGVIAWRQGDGTEAISLANKAQEIIGVGGDEKIMGSASALIASVLFDMGKYKKSLKANNEALEHFRSADDTAEVIRVLNNMGETHKFMGDYGSAIDYFNRGIKLNPGNGIKRSMAYLLTNLAECHIREERNLEARTFITMAGENVRNIEDEYVKAQIDFVWGLIHDFEGENESAISRYEEALSKMNLLGIPFDTGMILMAYGSMLKKNGDAEKSMAAFQEAVNCFSSIGSSALEEKARKALG